MTKEEMRIRAEDDIDERVQKIVISVKKCHIYFEHYIGKAIGAASAYRNLNVITTEEYSFVLDAVYEIIKSIENER